MRVLRPFFFLAILCAGAFGVNQALLHPDTPLPEEWNPTAPFDVAHPPSPLTDWKIRGLMAQSGQCSAALQSHGIYVELEPLIVSETCGIAQRVSVRSVGSTRMRPFETTCEVALRLALWERHGLQPAAEEIFGTRVAEIRHYSSYNCRKIRTSSGESNRWSTHATARAVDVSGFVLDTGELVDLKSHWDGDDAKAAFLRRAQVSGCESFGLVLGPEYNALHADHFHMQLDWRGCR